MTIKVVSLAMLIAILFGAVALPVSTVSAQNRLTVPVTGTIDGGGTFTGTLELTEFVVRSGTLYAQGLLSGTLTDAAGETIGTVTDLRVQLPVTQISGTCEILHLELGPLDLELLGLVVHLDKVVLDITAEQGGGLLGNLLCAVANLLDNGGSLSGIARLLNRILDALG